MKILSFNLTVAIIAGGSFIVGYYIGWFTKGWWEKRGKTEVIAIGKEVRKVKKIKKKKKR